MLNDKDSVVVIGVHLGQHGRDNGLHMRLTHAIGAGPSRLPLKTASSTCGSGVRRLIPVGQPSSLPCPRGRHKTNRLQVGDLNWLSRVRKLETEDTGVEEELGVIGAFDVFAFAKSVVLALECDKGYGEALSLDRFVH
jgi:hypothetical protein